MTSSSEPPGPHPGNPGNPDKNGTPNGGGRDRAGKPLTAGLSSPFTHHAPISGESPERLPEAHVEDVERVDKPWGHEEIFGVLEGRYVGKVLHITAGAALSLQKHIVKDETLSVRSGRITVEFGADPRRLRTLTLDPGQKVLIRAGLVHRITAAIDSEVLEVSTAWPGWRTDVVRLEDGYGRQGTTTA
jgi:mannose-6-phosphate isomerase-like protein (cupin superfamily)